MLREFAGPDRRAPRATSASDGPPPVGVPRRIAPPVIVGFGAALLALFVVGMLTLRHVDRASDARRWVEHTHEVLDVLGAVHATTDRAVDDARTAALTGDVPNPVALDALAARADALVRRAAVLTRDNAAQQAHLPALRRLTTAHFARLRHAAASAAAGHDVRTLLTRPALAVGDSLDVLLASMRDAERALLAARDTREQIATMHVRTQAAGGVGGAVVVCLAVLAVLWRDAGRRQRAERERDVLWSRMQDAREELEAQNEELLRQSEELGRESDARQAARDYLEAVLVHMADGVVAFDERRRVLLCNPAAQQLLGLPHGAVAVDDWPAYAEWREPNDGVGLAAADTPVACVRDGGTVCGRELVLAPVSAPARAVVATGRPVRDAGGRARGAILALHDVTDREAAARLKSELVSVVSHELRTPLTAIRGAFGLLEADAYGALPDRARRLVTIGRANSDRMIRLVNDLLDLEKLASGRLVLRNEPLDVARLVDAAVADVRGVATERAVRLVAAATVPGHLTVRGDADRLLQVLTNLLSNAIKFSPAQGTVSVHAAQSPAGDVRVSVQDTGPGIAEHDIARLFQRFQQLDASDTRHHGGTGLGLAITKELVEQHGGRIGVVSRLGHGARFWVELPAHRASSAADEGAGTPKQERAA